MYQATIILGISWGVIIVSWALMYQVLIKKSELSTNIVAYISLARAKSANCSQVMLISKKNALRLTQVIH